MGCGEECTGYSDCGGLTRYKAEQALHEIVLQKKLLVDGPEHVARDVREIGFVEGMQRADFRGDEHAECGEGDGSGQNPQRRDKSGTAEAQFIATLAAGKNHRQREDEGKRREKML